MTIRQKLLELRNTFKMNRLDIANFVGVTERAIYRWEGGNKNAHKAFEKKVDELLNLKKVERVARNG